MNINFVLFIIVLISIYVFLSDIIIEYWNNYSKYVFAVIAIFVVIIIYIKPYFIQKIIKDMIIYNKIPQPGVNLYGSNKLEIYNQQKTFNVSELKEKVILDSQSNKCFLCNNLLDNSYLLDFIIPIEYGGSYDNNNVTILCPSCYSEKNK